MSGKQIHIKEVGWGEYADDGTAVVVQVIDGSDGEVDLGLAVEVAEALAKVLVQMALQAREVAAKKQKPPTIVGYPADDIELFYQAETQQCRLELTSEDQAGLTILLPIHKVRKLGTAIDRMILTIGRSN